ncbi:MAG TPA: M14 family zinc carboxypeptidase [Bacteriovoracaceae bacterium]|nr:M14 family zinc carboxypeptidase [Bacteriovoracaceae bacterium]
MKTLIALLALTFVVTGYSAVKIEEEVYITGLGPEVVKDLIDTGSVEIDHVTSEGFEAYGSKGLKKHLDSKNIPYSDMVTVNKKMFAGYPTHEQITNKLKAAQAKNPGIIKLISIGKSVQGRELWMVKISDNVNVDEVEPEFKYISSMHGDEITGRELTTFLIEEIAAKYGSDAELTELVNNTEIYIMPSMNPDGSFAKRRANANGSDLNRNFPDITRDRVGTASNQEVETQAVMKFQATRKFALSANFHGGTIVANYPWDSKYDLHPLDDLVKELSTVYSDLNPEMRNSSEFPGGITNGAAWYVVKGGMQDWSYVFYNDLQITLEVSHTKYPDYSDIPDFYKSNRNSMVEFMKHVHQGAGIKLSTPGLAGTVGIKQVSPVSRNLGDYAFTGSEFYKILPEGSYVFTVKGSDGTAKTVEVRVEKGFVKANGNYVTL